ncbi:MAG: YceI family protein [Wenzhouxiangella sp.]
MVKRLLTTRLPALAGVLCASALLWAGPATAAECYNADQDSGELVFSGEAEGNRFEGRFREFTVQLCLDDDDLTTANIEVQIATGSATVGNRQGDRELLGEDLFAAERFPRAFWISDEISSRGDGRYFAEGELNLRQISASQPVQLQLAREGDQLALSGSAEIERLEFDVGQGEFADPDFITPVIQLNFELVLSPE